jgi:hypothetical protein
MAGRGFLIITPTFAVNLKKSIWEEVIKKPLKENASKDLSEKAARLRRR